MEPAEIAEIEIDVLLEAIKLRWDYDFHNYARASLARRIKTVLAREGLDMPYQLIPRILYNQDTFESFLSAMSVTVTEMFRNPNFYLGLVESVFSVLESYPFIKVWFAGCATGQEVYSLAILLREHGLLKRTKIYATDYNKNSLDIAQKGIYPAEDIEHNTKAYIEAGGKKEFSHYIVEQYGNIKLLDELKDNITFSYHNLVRDGVFGEMNLVICRNVIIYFDKELQNHVLSLFDGSLCRKGFLCLGPRETLDFSVIRKNFDVFSGPNKIYRRNH